MFSAALATSPAAGAKRDLSGEPLAQGPGHKPTPATPGLSAQRSPRDADLGWPVKMLASFTGVSLHESNICRVTLEQLL